MAEKYIQILQSPFVLFPPLWAAKRGFIMLNYVQNIINMTTGPTQNFNLMLFSSLTVENSKSFAVI